MDVDKTRVYFERSKSSPIINLSLDRYEHIFPDDPFLEVIPHVFYRLKLLSIKGTPENIQDITAHLSPPAPHLKHLSIDGGCKFYPDRNPVNIDALFNRDLSSLRELHLQSIRTELPWRNMSNLISFTLGHTFLGEVSIKQLIDFFKGAPRLRNVELTSATPTSGAEGCRSVSLACLKRMAIYEGRPPSLLLDHLVIPVGAKLLLHGDPDGFLIGSYLPSSLGNLENLSNFTEILLHVKHYNSHIRFSGPNGKVSIFPQIAQVATTCWALRSLAEFDTSGTKRLEIVRGNLPPVDFYYRALLPMKDLRTLTLSRCVNPYIFIGALHPDTSSSRALVCPELEELVLRIDREPFCIDDVIIMAAARASRGAKLKSVRIASQNGFSRADVLELKKHVLHVECGPEVYVASDGSDSSDEDD